jgi:hypothetical protein
MIQSKLLFLLILSSLLILNSSVETRKPIYKDTFHSDIVSNDFFNKEFSDKTPNLRDYLKCIADVTDPELAIRNLLIADNERVINRVRGKIRLLKFIDKWVFYITQAFKKETDDSTPISDLGKPDSVGNTFDDETSITHLQKYSEVLNSIITNAKMEMSKSESEAFKKFTKSKKLILSIIPGLVEDQDLMVPSEIAAIKKFRDTLEVPDLPVKVTLTDGTTDRQKELNRKLQFTNMLLLSFKATEPLALALRKHTLQQNFCKVAKMTIEMCLQAEMEFNRPGSMRIMVNSVGTLAKGVLSAAESYFTKQVDSTTSRTSSSTQSGTGYSNTLSETESDPTNNNFMMSAQERRDLSLSSKLSNFVKNLDLYFNDRTTITNYRLLWALFIKSLLEGPECHENVKDLLKALTTLTWTYYGKIKICCEGMSDFCHDYFSSYVNEEHDFKIYKPTENHEILDLFSLNR